MRYIKAILRKIKFYLFFIIVFIEKKEEMMYGLYLKEEQIQEIMAIFLASGCQRTILKLKFGM